MPETELPIEWGFWLAAFTPILVLLVLLVWRRWETSAAGPVGLAAAVVVALWVFQTPLRTLAVAAGKGIWDAIFILYVIWPALILYHVVEEAGAFRAMQQAIRRFMPDRLLVVLVFAWALSSFIQGIAGFGTPLAVTTPLLVGLGVQPLYAVLLPLIGRAWGNMFGSLGDTWFATLTVVDLQNTQQTLTYAALLLWIPNLTAGLTIAWMYGRWWAIKRAAPAIAVISLLHGGLQLALVPLLPAVGNFLATAAALGAVYLLNRWSFYRQEDEDEPNRIFTQEARQSEASEEEQVEPSAGASPPEGRMPLLLTFAPYGILAVLAVVALVVPPVRRFLEQVSIGLPFPESTTGYAVERQAVEAYAAFTPLTHPGTFLLLASAAGYLLYKTRGLYADAVTPWRILRRTAGNALSATTAITALLLISKVMDHSGQITVLALGIAAVAPSAVYVVASNFIGILGALITSSNTASNVLFAPLQATVARAEGVSVPLIIAAQSTGGATGNAVAPGDILLGATVAGIAERLGAILARALPWTLVSGLLVSAATLAIYLLL
jgi:lactate permease